MPDDTVSKDNAATEKGNPTHTLHVNILLTFTSLKLVYI